VLFLAVLIVRYGGGQVAFPRLRGVVPIGRGGER
jgi:hypothetical protein